MRESKSVRRSSLVLSAWILVGCGVTPITLAANPKDATKLNDTAPVRPASVQRAVDLSDSFKHAIRIASPSVVHITSRVQSPTPSTEDQDAMRKLLEEFLGERRTPSRPPQGYEQVSQGTGVITRDDGLIITNNHVVANAKEIQVTLASGKRHRAEVVGSDPDSDLAVIRIPEGGLTAAKFGDSDRLEVGDWVLALGNPFGLSNTVTSGIVSAIGRGNVGVATYEDFIQTDAAINPGNSGGPLVNLDGEVVGINTAIASNSGTYMGIGFSIPSRMVKRITRSLIENGSVERGWLGVRIQPLDERLARSLGFPGTYGVLVTESIDGQPAYEGGIREGDIVVMIDGKDIRTSNDLLNTIADKFPGERVEIEVFRQGRKRQFDIVLGDRRIGNEVAQQSDPPSPKKRRPGIDLGIDVGPLTTELIERLGVATESGVVVTQVDRESPAAKAGIEVGDVITKMGAESVKTLSDYEKIMTDYKGDEGLLFYLKSRDGARFVVVTPEPN